MSNEDPQQLQRAVSLFSNCGAGDLGFKRAGFQFDVMAELDPRRLEVALLNHGGAKGVPGDLRETWQTVVHEYRASAGNVRPSLLAACPPCQGMSSARGNRGKEDDAEAGSKDGRNLLVVIIANVAEQLQPDAIVVENVPAFLTKKVKHPETGLPVSAANLLISLLNEQYFVFPFLTDLCDYGIPQTRKRAFLTFLKRDLSGASTLVRENYAPYPKPNHAADYGGDGPVTLREALTAFGLPPLDAGSVESARSNVGNGLHAVPVWPDRRYQMVAAIPIDSGASAWQNDSCPSCGQMDVDNEAATCPKCGDALLRPVTWETDGSLRLIKGFRTSSYKRMAPGKPAATITTASGHIGSHTTLHPSETRVLSALECAYLQTFPEDFDWGEALLKWGHTTVREMIGEAVPPAFTERHGLVLSQILGNRIRGNLVSQSDRRCTKASAKLDVDRPTFT